MEKYEQAATLFSDGFRCSQAVFEVFAEELGIYPNTARKISIGLAAGSGAKGECGAVSAAYLVNGLIHGFSHPGDPEQFKIVMMKNIQFLEKFRAIHGKINCQELIGVDLFTDEGKKYFQENDIKTKLCTKFVEDSVKILQEIE
jgi:C_GCAxxG_C_C family probable redox protein